MCVPFPERGADFHAALKAPNRPSTAFSFSPFHPVHTSVVQCTAHTGAQPGLRGREHCPILQPPLQTVPGEGTHGRRRKAGHRPKLTARLSHAGGGRGKPCLGRKGGIADLGGLGSRPGPACPPSQAFHPGKRPLRRKRALLLPEGTRKPASAAPASWSGC